MFHYLVPQQGTFIQEEGIVSISSACYCSKSLIDHEISITAKTLTRVKVAFEGSIFLFEIILHFLDVLMTLSFSKDSNIVVSHFETALVIIMDIKIAHFLQSMKFSLRLHTSSLMECHFMLKSYHEEISCHLIDQPKIANLLPITKYLLNHQMNIAFDLTDPCNHYKEKSWCGKNQQ